MISAAALPALATPAAGATDPSAALANTGVPTATLIEFAVLLLVTGGAVLATSRRRQLVRR